MTTPNDEAEVASHDLLACPFCGEEAELEIEIRDDENRYPRPHWHAKVECTGCNTNQGWRVVSGQEAKKPTPKSVSKVVAEWNTRKANAQVSDQ